MKIAIFTDAYLAQLTAEAAHTSILASGLLKLGHDVLIVTSDRKADECYMQDNIVFCPAKASKNWCGQAIKPSKLGALPSLVDKFAPDLIHIHSFTELGLAGMKYAQKCNIPLACTLHELHDVRFGFEVNKAFDTFSKMQCQTIFKKITGAADIVMSASKKDIELADELASCKVKSIPFCIDTELFHYIPEEEQAKRIMRKRLRLKDGTAGFVYSGRLCEGNQVSTLLDLWSKSFSVSDNLQLIIVGTGRDEAALSDHTQLLGIAENVTFAGHLTRDDLSLCYSVCRAFVSTAESATMKASPIEAIACGLPAILPKNCANAEIITQAVNGFTYDDDRDFRELVLKLAYLDEGSDTQLKKLVSRTAASLTDINQAQIIEKRYEAAVENHKSRGGDTAAAGSK